MTKIAELITTSFKSANLMMNISQQEGAVFSHIKNMLFLFSFSLIFNDIIF
jgi:hypothetical protein